MNQKILELFNPERPIRSRLICFLGFIVCVPVIILGAVLGPSVYTVVGIFVIANPFIFIAGIINPQWILGRRRLCLYLVYSTIPALALVVYEVGFLLVFAHIN